MKRILLAHAGCEDNFAKTAKPSTVALQYRDGRYDVPKSMRYSD